VLKVKHVYELCALACPPEDSSLSAHDVLQYPAVQLLVDAFGPCKATSSWSMRMRRLPRESAGGLMEFHWQSNLQPAGFTYLASARPRACSTTD